MLRYRKVGGLRFLRIGRLQLSFCVCRPLGPQMRKLQAIRDREAAAMPFTMDDLHAALRRAAAQHRAMV